MNNSRRLSLAARLAAPHVSVPQRQLVPHQNAGRTDHHFNGFYRVPSRRGATLTRPAVSPPLTALVVQRRFIPAEKAMSLVFSTACFFSSITCTVNFSTNSQIASSLLQTATPCTLIFPSACSVAGATRFPSSRWPAQLLERGPGLPWKQPVSGEGKVWRQVRGKENVY